jgi:hypothetical protein
VGDVVSGSSGVAIRSVTKERGCDNCGWSGLIDLVIDPEIDYAGWECPSCLTAHDESDTLSDGPDPDDARDRELFDI